MQNIKRERERETEKPLAIINMTLNCVNNNNNNSVRSMHWFQMAQAAHALNTLLLLLLLSFEHLSAHVSQTNEFVQIYREPQRARKKNEWEGGSTLQQSWGSTLFYSLIENIGKLLRSSSAAHNVFFT